MISKNASKKALFCIVAIAQFMIVMDGQIANVALPHMQHDLEISNTVLPWVVSIYMLAFGGFLLLGGRIADMWGRTRLLLAGVAGFTLASLTVAIAQSSEILLIGRFCQGLAAACISPAALSIVLTLFTKSAERNKALGYWTVVTTAGGAAGMLLGGLIAQYMNWRWNFLINIPLGLVALPAIWYLFPPETKQKLEQTSNNIVGPASITLSLLALALLVSQGDRWGWNGLTLGTTAVLAASALLFYHNEKTHPSPIIPLSFLKLRNTMGANTVIALLFSPVMALFYLLTLYLQNKLGFTPFQTGLSFIVFPITMGALAPFVSRLVTKVGYKRVLLMGQLILSVGFLWLCRLPEHAQYTQDILPSLIAVPAGISFAMVASMSAATQHVPNTEAGLVSGTMSTFQQLGGALGLSILSSVASLHRSLSHGIKAAFLSSLVMLAIAFVVTITVITSTQKSTTA